MPNTAAAEDHPTEKKLLQIFVDVADRPDIHVAVFSTPPGVNADDVDCIVVTLNKANASVAKALQDGDRDEIMRLVNFALVHDMTKWSWHYPLHSSFSANVVQKWAMFLG